MAELTVTEVVSRFRSGRDCSRLRPCWNWKRTRRCSTHFLPWSQILSLNYKINWYFEPRWWVWRFFRSRWCFTRDSEVLRYQTSRKQCSCCVVGCSRGCGCWSFSFPRRGFWSYLARGLRFPFFVIGKYPLRSRVRDRHYRSRFLTKSTDSLKSQPSWYCFGFTIGLFFFWWLFWQMNCLLRIIKTWRSQTRILITRLLSLFVYSFSFWSWT